MGAWAPKEQRWFCLNALLERARADIQLQQRKQQQQSKENVRPGFAVAVESRSGTADGEQKHSGDEVVKGSKKAPVEVRKQIRHCRRRAEAQRRRGGEREQESACGGKEADPALPTASRSTAETRW